ncbi:MAG: hypothetical protein ABI651_15255, partial [Verrucomicrobiota bacterium]
RARRFSGTLELQVSDNGAGIARGQAFEEGVGLSNTRARLQQLYGKAHRFDFSNGMNGGLVVSVTIPLRLETNGAAK